MDNTFGTPIIPENENERLAELRRLDVFNTYDEQGTFKHIAAMATRMFDVNIGALCILDRQPKEFSAIDQKILANLASIIMEEMEKTAKGLNN